MADHEHGKESKESKEHSHDAACEKEGTNYEQYHKNLRRTTDLSSSPKIEGFDFDHDFAQFDIEKFLSAYSTTGFQGAELGKGIQIVNKMLNDQATIFLSMTGNAISSGLREVIAFLVKNKCVGVIITTASGVEEDIIKSLSDFRQGDFDVPGRTLFEYGVGRIGNIFVPNDRYLHLERFMGPFFEKLYEMQKKSGKPVSPTQFSRLIGLEISDEKSYLHWAARNGIPVYCPGIMDGSLGDLLYFFKHKHPDFYLDVTDDHKRLIDFVLQQEKTGGLILGGGIAKHYALNAQIFKEGFDYAVYLTTALEFDGSDSGGNQEEAKTWAKIKINAPTVKIKADFTLTFPLLVAGSFARWVHRHA